MREIEFQKVSGSKDIADMFTNAFDGETLTRHAESLENGLWGNDDNAAVVPIRAFGAIPGGTDIHDKVVELYGRDRSSSARSRFDLASRTLRSTLRGGPSSSAAMVRITGDANSGEFISLREGGPQTEKP